MKTETVGTGTLETWTVDEVQAAFDANEIVLIDVRTPQEYMFEHVDGALLFPMSFFKAHKLPSQDGKRIVFHCGSGMRSERVARAALAAGIHTVAHMEGGFGAWKAAGKPYMGTDMATGAPQYKE
ncbi:rhodanese-like domain-containing protein [Donghicola sp. C2-DW-16]|uniref:Rhodanese-like domain-containing protein n=1 Tax=Donghicola mangrovi TaxID=2729614 RepID=A0A850PYK1_9RHOB|nr:rhodanese-like domain-containing protein [Donghicola mangrovi]NVO22337.1 rhodanese-like domain-containing protein [Donghicola mangrovi]NVO26072.1 rhodanese-like domain-containing protein [Donghicola mangrovi]